MALQVGEFAAVETGRDDLFAYTRTHGDERFLIVLNFGTRNYRLDLSHVARRAEIALTTGMQSAGEVPMRSLYVVPDEGIVLRLK